MKRTSAWISLNFQRCDDCEEKRTAALAKHAAYRERYTE